MPIAELFLGAFLSVLFDRLASPELLNFARREGIGTRLKKWEQNLIEIKKVLDAAEQEQLNGNGEVTSWLKKLGNLAYDIEDLLDEFAIESAESKSKAEPSTSKARSLLPSCCFGLSPKALMFDHEMGSKIEKMDNTLQEIVTLKDGLGLRENKEKRPTERTPTTSLCEPWFVSREDDKREILKLLTQKEDDGTCVGGEVIAIVGMPGLGKTALAQQVYNDARVKGCFDVTAWACISDNFKVPDITRSILQQIGSTLSCKDEDFNWLQNKLNENLLGKKFLVVLDDIWNRNPKKWDEFLKPFRSGAEGSKIIVTTRDSHIAKITRAKEYSLKKLSEDACMTLLAFHAFGVGNFNDRPNLEVLGRKIAEKCKGLPLAATTLGGLLRCYVSPHEWEEVLESKIWNAQEENNGILPALKLSYLHLPPNLRRCFAYCAIFPKDYEIERDELIHWWSAEGLLEGEKRKSRWNTGLNYFNELVSRSLIQKSDSDESQFFMHDLVNDLAKLVAGATCFDLAEFEGDHNTAFVARHASFILGEYILPKEFKIYHEMESLRSFISVYKASNSRYKNFVFVSQKVLCDLLSASKYLRVLSLSQYHITEVPESIGKLRHLRHLNLSYTCIKKLPKSIVTLYNLEALMLRGCEDLVELPEGIEKLINLKFLDITDTERLEAMPLYIGNLMGLEMLSKFVVGTRNGSRLKELKNLKNLQGELCISDLHMVQDSRDAINANLHTKMGLCRLTMQWSRDFENFRNEELEAEVLQFLRPHQNLEKLGISYYGGQEFPSWLGCPSYVNVVQLRLHGCQSIKALPSLGQLSLLKDLYIEGLNAICTVGSEFYGSKSPFPSLITLEFKDMPLWKDWSHCVDTEEVGVIFPRLEHLIIRRCPALVGRLPSQLSSLIKLEIYSCPCMDASSSIMSLPSLNELNFGDCNEGVLKNLVHLASPTALAIDDVSDLTCLNHGFTSSLTQLEKLTIGRCTELIYLWQDRDVIRNLACLKSLLIRNCPKLRCFVAGERDIELPGNLDTIKLTNCVNLEKLPSKMHTLSALRGLTVNDCPKLVSFPETGIPTSTISLNISRCEMLQSLPRGGLSVHLDEPSSSGSNTHGDMTPCLEKLTISECDSLPASPFSDGRFLPATLKRLEIRGCRGVESLAEINVDGLQSLQEISIWGCENLRSLPQGLHTLSHLASFNLSRCPALELDCFPPLPPSISSFHLIGCPKIKSLPNQLNRLTRLCSLDIGWCEGITHFPDGELPPQLQSLSLYDCGNIKQPVGEWLSPLTSLEELLIYGSVGGAGEEEDLVLPLPPSLLDLRIFDMGRVERLSCSLPPSLRMLWIARCPKLRELPQDGLPPSLEELWIEECGILEERCKKGTGYCWPLIREIPYLSLMGIII
ncbi:putative disease resistance RPP13-like protein 1 [Syzygium oleosum]|uniref:putative disease resistance RPP13-like protein 1 n=1 Tax=Syzygium oleosum TaxID=219896 RepID=UPI0011D1FF81|nr:putative disease resistance RPP13-like protein 1 [Syzygium oleosum]XP_056165805.1 putative disease resistance RPP13-like protein 1 [Syzygium oleosum]XP_056165806.1 putative disease resistance RPP13-like protein 1 [Syzygium oleosum]XP_056165807.1 putative disease resistance RPP13-like protein 1 [Syzygium oleosum]